MSHADIRIGTLAKMENGGDVFAADSAARL